VDDNDVNKKVALKMLSHFGFTNCDTASDGVQALQLFKERKYDLILMDCMMPV
jgi:CheY-like chemotaxis protein